VTILVAEEWWNIFPCRVLLFADWHSWSCTALHTGILHGVGGFEGATA
jgi:hypothetical protein